MLQFANQLKNERGCRSRCAIIAITECSHCPLIHHGSESLTGSTPMKNVAVCSRLEESKFMSWNTRACTIHAAGCNITHMTAFGLGRTYVHSFGHDCVVHARAIERKQTAITADDYQPFPLKEKSSR